MCKKIKCDFSENEILKKYTSFKIGGPADLFLHVKNIDSLKEILKKINFENIPFFILGKGSNLLVADEGYNGVVISLESDFKNITRENENIVCSAGASLAKACVFSMQNELSGLEFAWGIPGSCGGALFMNAGAYGNDISDVILEATHITPDGKIETITKNEMNLSYRKSIYCENNSIILSLKFGLLNSEKEAIKSKMYEIISKRKSKQPLNYPSAGSTFKRPGGGYYAAALIESAGLKGTSVGGAMVSTKHSGFIVNTGNATAKDVINLIYLIKDKIYKDFKVIMECEVKTLGNIKI